LTTWRTFQVDLGFSVVVRLASSSCKNFQKNSLVTVINI
jgi:hypothetical protein